MTGHSKIDIALACTAWSACIGSLITSAMPYLQIAAVILSIVASVVAIRRSK